MTVRCTQPFAGLPEEFRDALVAVDVAGLSYGEAARMLGARGDFDEPALPRARRVAQRLDPRTEADQ